MKRQRLNSLLGLTFDEGRLHGVLVRRTNGSVRLERSFTAALTLDLLSSETELAGREIRNALTKEGIRERHCVICLPLSWVLSLQITVPDLPEEDLGDFFDIEAERGFPYGMETLLVRHSRSRGAGGGQNATLAAVPRDNLARFEAVLKAAQLKPAGFSLGITALQPAETDSQRGILAVSIGENSVDLEVTAGGGVVALRSLKGVVETTGAQRELLDELLAREIRITLGQLPAEFRESVRTVRVFGRGDALPRFVRQIEGRLTTMGLSVEAGTRWRADDFNVKLPLDAPVTPEFGLAARYAANEAPAFEFLPPKTVPWRQFLERHASKRLQLAGAAAAAVVLLAGGTFGVQAWQLSRLESEWAKMRPKVEQLDKLQEQIRKYRPWFDESHRSLSVLRKLTEAFPEDGVVSAKTVEIRDASLVTCTGTARDHQSLMKVLDQLRAAREITDVKVPVLTGVNPVRFTFNFKWATRGGNEN